MDLWTLLHLMRDQNVGASRKIDDLASHVVCGRCKWILHFFAFVKPSEVLLFPKHL